MTTEPPTFTAAADPPAAPPHVDARRRRAQEQVAGASGVDLALLCDPANLRWLGVPEAAGSVAVVSPEKVAVLSTDIGSTMAARRRRQERREAAEMTLDLALAAIGVGSAEPVMTDGYGLVAGLTSRVCLPLCTGLGRARMVKDRDEVALIARAAELVGIGQSAARGAVTPNVSELELWAAARAAMEAAAGPLSDVLVDLMIGERTAAADLPPSAHRAAAGDLVLFDLAPRRDGYWADSCATFSVGPPAPAAVRRHDVVRAALERGISLARPGMTASRLDAEVRAVLDEGGLECQHHCGHGVGTTAQEPPWLTPGDDTVLESGMVLALEPGVYGQGLGVRLEHLIHIDERETHLLTTHSIDLT
jgi:Xaa-Pro aminopeptidase